MDKLEEIKGICLEYYYFGNKTGGYWNDESTNATHAFWDILRLLGVSQEEMDAHTEE